MCAGHIIDDIVAAFLACTSIATAFCEGMAFLLANARALETGAARVECEIDGKPWVQQPFPYQGKCLAALRAERAKLAGNSRSAVDALLAGTGCEALFA